MYTEADKIATYKYRKKNIKRVVLDLPKAEYEQIKEYCDKNNLSVSGFIRALVKEKIS